MWEITYADGSKEEISLEEGLVLAIKGLVLLVEETKQEIRERKAKTLLEQTKTAIRDFAEGW